MLNILNYLHECKILHADIKPDNFLIDALPDSLAYFIPDRTKCLVLIDFNRSIDQNSLPDQTEFVAKCDNKSLLCCEMKLDKSWSKQVNRDFANKNKFNIKYFLIHKKIDYYGVLYSIHCLVFKKYMNLFNVNGKYKMTSAFPRSYDGIFSRLFETYLNLPSSQKLPNLEKEYIDELVPLFRNELASSFSKSKQYLNNLHTNYKPSADTKAKMKN